MIVNLLYLIVVLNVLTMSIIIEIKNKLSYFDFQKQNGNCLRNDATDEPASR